MVLTHHARPVPLRVHAYRQKLRQNPTPARVRHRNCDVCKLLICPADKDMWDSKLLRCYFCDRITDPELYVDCKKVNDTRTDWNGKRLKDGKGWCLCSCTCPVVSEGEDSDGEYKPVLEEEGEDVTDIAPLGQYEDLEARLCRRYGWVTNVRTETDKSEERAIYLEAAMHHNLAISHDMGLPAESSLVNSENRVPSTEVTELLREIDPWELEIIHKANGKPYEELEKLFPECKGMTPASRVTISEATVYCPTCEMPLPYELLNWLREGYGEHCASCEMLMQPINCEQDPGFEEPHHSLHDEFCQCRCRCTGEQMLRLSFHSTNHPAAPQLNLGSISGTAVQVELWPNRPQWRSSEHYRIANHGSAWRLVQEDHGLPEYRRSSFSRQSQISSDDEDSDEEADENSDEDSLCDSDSELDPGTVPNAEELARQPTHDAPAVNFNHQQSISPVTNNPEQTTIVPLLVDELDMQMEREHRRTLDQARSFLSRAPNESHAGDGRSLYIWAALMASMVQRRVPRDSLWWHDAEDILSQCPEEAKEEMQRIVIGYDLA